jgi:hypothetical protein
MEWINLANPRTNPKSAESRSRLNGGAIRSHDQSGSEWLEILRDSFVLGSSHFWLSMQRRMVSSSTALMFAQRDPRAYPALITPSL